MDALTRLREAIEDTHDGSRPLNDETYRTMMEDLRKVYQSIPQQVERPAVMVAQQPIAGPTETVVNWDGVPSSMPGDHTIQIPTSEYYVMKNAIRNLTGAYQFGDFMVPIVSLMITKMNAGTLTKRGMEDMTQYQKHLFDTIARHIYNQHGGTYNAEFYEKLSKTWWWRSFIVNRVHRENKMCVSNWLIWYHKFMATNPDELANPKHLPMVCYFSLGRNGNLVGSLLKFEEMMEAGRKGGDFVANLKKTNTERLHKLSITLRLSDKSTTFEAYTNYIKMGSVAGITDCLHQIIFLMDFLEGKVNTKVMKTAIDIEERVYPPTLEISGITAHTKDKRREYKDRHEQFIIRYISKLNNGE